MDGIFALSQIADGDHNFVFLENINICPFSSRAIGFMSRRAFAGTSTRMMSSVLSTSSAFPSIGISDYTGSRTFFSEGRCVIIGLFPDSGFKAFPAPVSPSGAAVAGFSVFFGFTFLYPDSRITLLMLSQQTLLPVQHVPPVHRHLPPPKQSTLLLSTKI